MSTDTLTDLLNKVSAIVKSGASSFSLMSQETGIPPRALYEIIDLRRFRPNGERALALHQWAEKMTVRIAMMEDRSIQAKYRAKYREVCERFPVNGKD